MSLTHREVFFGANGFGPYPCHGCDITVTVEEVHVHHLDHNHSNNDPANLAAVHPACHTRLHVTGRPLSPEHLAKLRAQGLKNAAAMKGSQLSPERRAEISRSSTGRVHSAESREAMSRAQKGRAKSPEHRAKISAALKARKGGDAR